MKADGKQKEYNSRCYSKNKTSILKRLRNRKNERTAAVRKAKDKPCADCGVQYDYWIMQFDHVRGKKLGNLGRMVWKAGLKRILAEIEKCDIVCANCHADRTYKRNKGPICHR